MRLFTFTITIIGLIASLVTIGSCFSSLHPNLLRFIVMKADGSNKTQLTINLADDQYPSWSAGTSTFSSSCPKETLLGATGEYHVIKDFLDSEITLDEGQSWSLTFTPASDEVIVSMQARIAHPNIGGWAQIMEVFVNGEVVTDQHLSGGFDTDIFVSKGKGSYKYYGDQGVNLWMVFYSPDYRNNCIDFKLSEDQEEKGWADYQVTDGYPYVREFNITELVKPGETNMVQMTNRRNIAYSRDKFDIDLILKLQNVRVWEKKTSKQTPTPTTSLIISSFTGENSFDGWRVVDRLTRGECRGLENTNDSLIWNEALEENRQTCFDVTGAVDYFVAPDKFHGNRLNGSTTE